MTFLSIFFVVVVSYSADRTRSGTKGRNQRRRRPRNLRLNHFLLYSVAFFLKTVELKTYLFLVVKFCLKMFISLALGREFFVLVKPKLIDFSYDHIIKTFDCTREKKAKLRKPNL